MKLTSIRLQNIVTHLDTTVQLDGQGLCLVKGTNGAGKSSVIKALLFCLFGTGTDSIVNNIIGKDACVTLEGTNESDSFIVQRYRKHSKHKNNLYFFINSNPIAAATNTELQKKLEQYIGCDSRAFSNIASFSGHMMMFASSTDSERKAIFEKILQDLEVYNDYYQRAKEELDELKAQQSVNDQNIEILSREVDLVKKVLVQEEERASEEELKRLKKLEQMRSSLVDLEKKAGEGYKIHAKIKRYEHAQIKLDYWLSIHDDPSFAWAKNRGYIEQWQEYIEALTGSTCLYCQQDITDEHRCKETARAEEEHKKLKELDKKLGKEGRVYTAVYEKVYKLESQCERWSFKMTKYEELDKQIYQLGMAIADIEVEEVNRDTIRTWKRKLKKLSRDITTTKNRNKKAEDRLLYLGEVAKGFSKTGIPNVIIARALGMLEERTNGYLDILTSGKLGVTFSGFKLTKKGGVRNKIGIDVVSESGVASYGTYSGGERQRLNIAILLALRDVAEYNKGIKLNCLFLDEVLDLSLDEEGIEEVLSLLQSKKSAVDSIFIISPKASMLYNTAIEFDNVYTVTKQGGVSAYGK